MTSPIQFLRLRIQSLPKYHMLCPARYNLIINEILANLAEIEMERSLQSPMCKIGKPKHIVLSMSTARRFYYLFRNRLGEQSKILTWFRVGKMFELPVRIALYNLRVITSEHAGMAIFAPISRCVPENGVKIALLLGNRYIFTNDAPDWRDIIHVVRPYNSVYTRLERHDCYPEGIRQNTDTFCLVHYSGRQRNQH